MRRSDAQFPIVVGKVACLAIFVPVFVAVFVPVKYVLLLAMLPGTLAASTWGRAHGPLGDGLCREGPHADGGVLPGGGD
jgi:hypothetical protein